MNSARSEDGIIVAASASLSLQVIHKVGGHVQSSALREEDDPVRSETDDSELG